MPLVRVTDVMFMSYLAGHEWHAWHKVTLQKRSVSSVVSGSFQESLVDQVRACREISRMLTGAGDERVEGGKGGSARRGIKMFAAKRRSLSSDADDETEEGDTGDKLPTDDNPQIRSLAAQISQVRLPTPSSFAHSLTFT